MLIIKQVLLLSTGCFNERLVLSLASNGCCLFMDDELNILPSSSHLRSIQPVPLGPDGKAENPDAASKIAELKELIQSLADTQACSQHSNNMC